MGISPSHEKYQYVPHCSIINYNFCMPSAYTTYIQPFQNLLFDFTICYFLFYKNSYTAALGVTVGVGCLLLVLNMLIFAGIYYQRERSKRKTRRPRCSNGSTSSSHDSPIDGGGKCSCSLSLIRFTSIFVYLLLSVILVVYLRGTLHCVYPLLFHKSGNF